MGCSIIGYVFMGLAVRSSPGDAMYALRSPRALGVLFCLQGFGSFTLYKLGLVVNVHNMPVARRGSAVAMLAACLGISASVFTLIYNTMDANVSGILFIMGFSVMGMSLLCALFVRRVDPAEAWGAEAAGVAPSADSDAERPMLSTHGSFVIPPPAAGSAAADDRDGTGYLRMPSHQLDEELMYGSTNNSSHGHSGGAQALGVETPLTHLSKEKLVAAPMHFDSEEARLQYEAGEQERAQLVCQANTLGGGLAGQVFGAVYFLVRTRVYWIMMTVFILVAGVSHSNRTYTRAARPVRPCPERVRECVRVYCAVAHDHSASLPSLVTHRPLSSPHCHPSSPAPCRSTTLATSSSH